VHDPLATLGGSHAWFIQDNVYKAQSQSAYTLSVVWMNDDK